jgi:hypothetical protein
MASAGFSSDGDLVISDEIRKGFRKFKLSSSACGAILYKLSKESKLELDEEMPDESFDDIQEELPEGSPRFVFVSFRVEKGDGRVLFPLVFVFYCPIVSPPKLRVMYTRFKNAIAKEFDVNKIVDLRDKDDFSEEWLKSKLY